MAIKIYVDQGHNPVNPNAGAEGNGLREQNIVYVIGQELAALLRQNGNFEVRLSRPTPETQLGSSNASSLAARVNDANSWGADYFISLHINSFTSDTVTGIEVYTADGDEVGYDIGEDILNSLVKATGLRNRNMKDGSNLRVLKNATMPAALVEMGFISNPNDAKMLDESPELFAQGVFDGIKAYFDALEAETPEE